MCETSTMDLELFLADLSGRFDTRRRLEMDRLVEDLTDAERVGVTLSSRMIAMRGRHLDVLLRGGERLGGVVVDVAESWVLVRTAGGDSLVPLSAVVAAWPMGGMVAGGPGPGDRVGIDHVLREAAGLGLPVVIDHDAGLHTGVVIAVLADHFDLDPADRSVWGAGGAGSAAMDSPLVLSLSGIRRVRLLGPLG